MAKYTWLGDEDPSVQVIEQFGYTFVKGEPTDVPDKDKASLEKLKGNQTFSTDAKAEPVASDEPAPVDPDVGTEKAALKAELAKRGVSMKGNPSVDTLRAKLAETVAE